MAISITRYIDITSGVGGVSNFGTRDLVGRFFTTNPLVPTGSVVSFDSADEVLDYFGSASEEYARAAFYFGWVSKVVTKATSIQFAHWNDAASAPLIYGTPGAQALATWNAISSGAFTLQLAGTSHTMSAMDFSGAASLAAVAAIIQAAIRSEGTGAIWDAATVQWNSTRQSFDFTGGATGVATIAVTAGGGGSDIANQLGWLSATTIISEGAAIQTITDLLADSSEGDNNFGSFAFLATLTTDQITEAAEWNDTQNNLFLYSVPCTSSNASALSTALIDLSGVTLSLAPLANEFPEQVPMMVLAATDYTARASVQNYMFQTSFDLTPSVSTNADAGTYDALRVNYYGSVQTAGVTRSFYQRGRMMGGVNDPLLQNIYVNEIWFKDASTVALMNLLLALPQIPANNVGRGLILNQLQGIIDTALFNGTIEVGKALTDDQKAFITTVTGDNKAWIQVQNSGWWVSARIVSELVDDVTEYRAVYTLIYSKNDVINKIDGSDILI